MKNFAITGVAGYIAPRHLAAIKDTGNVLLAAIDPHDSVGVIDRYFPDAAFFTEIERFDRHLEKLRRGPAERRIDYLSICSPNHLHDAHIRLALRVGADAVCEKPIILNPWNLDALQQIEMESGKKVYTILQLRVHPSLQELKRKIESAGTNTRYKVCLTYITSRGLWYNYSWKGNPEKSGGVVTNIGIHFFDLLIWLFGAKVYTEVHLAERNRMSGFLELKNAEVSWYLSIDKNDLPEAAKAQNKTTYRSIKINNEEIEFTDGFTDLHTKVYREVLDGRGYGIEAARPSIETVYQIRNSSPAQRAYVLHPILNGKTLTEK